MPRMMMRILFGLAMVVIPAAAQNPLVRLLNASHPANIVFQVGDRFEVLITGAPNQPISVRTTMDGRIDWGPVIGSTDSTGRWSTTGQFEKSDFGSGRRSGPSEANWRAPQFSSRSHPACPANRFFCCIRPQYDADLRYSARTSELLDPIQSSLRREIAETMEYVQSR
jgi:hypothetical protein